MTTFLYSAEICNIYVSVLSVLELFPFLKYHKTFLEKKFKGDSKPEIKSDKLVKDRKKRRSETKNNDQKSANDKEMEKDDAGVAVKSHRRRRHSKQGTSEKKHVESKKERRHSEKHHKHHHHKDKTEKSPKKKKKEEKDGKSHNTKKSGKEHREGKHKKAHHKHKGKEVLEEVEKLDQTYENVDSEDDITEEQEFLKQEDEPTQPSYEPLTKASIERIKEAGKVEKIPESKWQMEYSAVSPEEGEAERRAEAAERMAEAAEMEASREEIVSREQLVSREQVKQEPHGQVQPIYEPLSFFEKPSKQDLPIEHQPTDVWEPFGKSETPRKPEEPWRVEPARKSGWYDAPSIQEGHNNHEDHPKQGIQVDTALHKHIALAKPEEHFQPPYFREMSEPLTRMTVGQPSTPVMHSPQSKPQPPQPERNNPLGFADSIEQKRHSSPEIADSQASSNSSVKTRALSYKQEWEIYSGHAKPSAANDDLPVFAPFDTRKLSETQKGLALYPMKELEIKPKVEDDYELEEGEILD